jgi:hypothetical protein
MQYALRKTVSSRLAQQLSLSRKPTPASSSLIIPFSGSPNHNHHSKFFSSSSSTGPTDDGSGSGGSFRQGLILGPDGSPMMDSSSESPSLIGVTRTNPIDEIHRNREKQEKQEEGGFSVDHGSLTRETSKLTKPKDGGVFEPDTGKLNSVMMIKRRLRLQRRCFGF